MFVLFQLSLIKKKMKNEFFFFLWGTHMADLPGVSTCSRYDEPTVIKMICSVEWYRRKQAHCNKIIVQVITINCNNQENKALSKPIFNLRTAYG